MHVFKFWKALGMAVALWGAAARVCAEPDADEPVAQTASAASVAAAASGVASAPLARSPVRRWMRVARVAGRLTAQDLGLVINQDDPYSVQVGEYYARARQIPPERILRVSLPLKPSLSVAEFQAFANQVDVFFGNRVQALALAWRAPYAVECNAITGALTLGYDSRLCRKTCGPSRVSTYFNSPSIRPYSDYGQRLSMLVAAPDVASAKALIDRGVKSDGTAGLRGGTPVRAHLVTTSDAVRSTRERLFPPAGLVGRFGVEVVLDRTDALRDAERVMFYQTGRVKVEHLDSVQFAPGALADHLTSFGGALHQRHDQMTVLSWIEAGATASYGTTSEPCAHLQKFPHPQVLILSYVQGATAIEAYWKSVLWPQQGLFIGEPLAAPFAH